MLARYTSVAGLFSSTAKISHRKSSIFYNQKLGILISYTIIFFIFSQHLYHQFHALEISLLAPLRALHLNSEPNKKVH